MKASDPDRPPNRAERRRRAKMPVVRGDAAMRALMRDIDALQADPRPWRRHELTEAEEVHAAELAVEFAHLID